MLEVARAQAASSHPVPRPATGAPGAGLEFP